MSQVATTRRSRIRSIPHVAARLAAKALMGVQRTLIDYVRQRVLADDGPGRLAADVRSLGKHAFALLADGLGDYARKPPTRTARREAPAVASRPEARMQVSRK